MRTRPDASRHGLAVAFVATLLCAGLPAAAEAPARVPLVTDAEAAPPAAKIFSAIEAGGSQPLAMHRAVANAPELFAAYVSMAQALRRDDHVPRQMRELVILRTLQIENGSYEIDQHRRMALSCGLTEAQLGDLSAWRGSALFDDRQRAVLDFVEAVATPAGPTDESYAALSHYFDPHAVVQITLTAGFYAMSARTTRALGVLPERPTGSGYGAC